MKKKSKQSASSEQQADVRVSTKRKKKFSAQQPAKRTKLLDQTEGDGGDDTYTERFKYVLAPKSKQNNNEINGKPAPQKQAKVPEKRKHGSQQVQEEMPKKAAYGHNGKANLMSLYESDEPTGSSSDDEWRMAEDEMFSSDDSLLDEDLESTDDEYSSVEEWETDTDYSEQSFHESDCESVTDEEHEYDSRDDSDYRPDIEDKYVKKGEAVLYDAKGLDLAFGNSNDSQIIEINDVDAVVRTDSEEDIPPLVPMEGVSQDGSPKSINDAEITLANMSLDDDEEAVKSSQLLKRAQFYNCANDQGVVVRLNSKIHFHGILIIRPLINRLQINGYMLPTNETLSATSISRADYYLNLTPVIIEDNSSFDKDAVCSDLKKLLDPSHSAEDVMKDFDRTKEVLLHLQQGLPDSKIITLQTYSPHPILPHKNMILNNSACPSSELMLRTKFFVDDENPKLTSFKINHDWDYIEMRPSLKVMVIGGKNVGKTALTQYLINKSISKHRKILLIDLDIGQPIVAPCQTVSATLVTRPLIGAGYLSDLAPDKSFFFGDVSVMLNPFKYVEYVLELLKFCHENEDYKDIPWIINTMGYQKGFGLQLMCVLLRIVQPTDVVQIQHRNNSYNFKCILMPEFANEFHFMFFPQKFLQQLPGTVTYTTHVLDSVVNDGGSGGGKWVSNASEKRKMAMIAQLGRLMRGGQPYLNDVVPFSASIEAIQLVVMDQEYKSCDRDVNLNLLNGNLVYLCHQNESVDAAAAAECFGVGVVRAIDKVHGKIYILLPENNNDIEKLQCDLNMLALGKAHLPAEILLKQNFGVVGKVPYVTFFGDRSSSNKKYINRRNIKDCF